MLHTLRSARGYAMFVAAFLLFSLCAERAHAGAITQPTNPGFETLVGGQGSNTTSLTGWARTANAGQVRGLLPTVTWSAPAGTWSGIVHTAGTTPPNGATLATFLGYANEAAMETAFGSLNVTQGAAVQQAVTINNPGDYLQFVYQMWGGQSAQGDFAFLVVDDGVTITSTKLLTASATTLSTQALAATPLNAAWPGTWTNYASVSHSGEMVARHTFTTTGTYTISIGIAEVGNTVLSPPAMVLDDVVINPEPGTWALFGIGVTLLAWRARRRARRSGGRA